MDLFLSQYLKRRLQKVLITTQLAFPCYRIRRLFALPLPLHSLPRLELQVRWYESSPFHSFILTPEEARQQVQLRGFVRTKKEPEQKLSATSSILGPIVD